jgi:putative spermidine/putrescine transport system permease protein
MRPSPMSENTGKWRGWLVLPGLALVAILASGLGDLIWKSFHSYNSYLNQVGGLSLAQYKSIVSGPTAGFYRTVLLRTLWLSVLVTIGSTLGAIPIAYYITRTKSRALRALALTLALVPFLVGEFVRAFGWLLLLGRNGVAGWAGGLVGDKGYTLIGTTFGIWLGALQTMLPIAVFILLPGLRRVEPDLERAAGTLGASPRRVWLEVVIPLLRPALTAAAVVVFALTMTEYAIPDIVGAGLLPFAANAIQNTFFTEGDIVLGSALAVLLLVLVMAGVVVILGVGSIRGRRGAGDVSELAALHDVVGEVVAP